jgi:hypothetical protein
MYTLGQFAHWGFTLEHPDRLILMHEGEPVVQLSQIVTTPETLQEECARHLALYHRWDGCLWSRKEAE